jgi:hypothetical protein
MYLNLMAYHDAVRRILIIIFVLNITVALLKGASMEISSAEVY